jgi:hypothetical protein
MDFSKVLHLSQCFILALNIEILLQSCLNEWTEHISVVVVGVYPFNALEIRRKKRCPLVEKFLPPQRHAA